MAAYRATGSLATSRIVLDGATQWCYTMVLHTTPTTRRYVAVFA
jgi:hypothetical protein